MQQSLLSICLIISRLCFTCTFKQSSEFFRVANNDNKYPTTNVVKEVLQISSLTSCSAICSRRVDSSSFFYSGKLQKCVCTRQVGQDQLQSRAGYIQFSTTEISPWRVFGKSQYLHIQTKKSWIDAQIGCRKFGATLAEIETPEENTFLKNLARQNNYGSAYIGGTEALSLKKWIWFTNFTPINFTDWYWRRPEVLPMEDFCLALTYEFHYQWDDWECFDYQFSSICERKMI